MNCLQHSALYTLGKRGRQEDFHTPVEVLRRRGVKVYEIGRGGETTFHGPGQVVLYPIVSLRRLGRGARAYVEGLEDTIISALLQFGISAQVGCPFPRLPEPSRTSFPPVTFDQLSWRGQLPPESYSSWSCRAGCQGARGCGLGTARLLPSESRFQME